MMCSTKMASPDIITDKPLKLDHDMKRRRSSSSAKLAATLAILKAQENDSEKLTGQLMHNYPFFLYLAKKMSIPNTPSFILSKRAMLLLVYAILEFASIMWGLMFAMLGLSSAAYLCWTFTAVVSFSFGFMTGSKQYESFQFIALFSILFFPAAVQHAIGGVVKSGCVALWGVLAPIGGTLFESKEEGKSWFIRFCVSTIILLCIESAQGDYIHNMTIRRENLEIFFFLLNIIGASATIFLACRVFSVQIGMEYERSDALLCNVLPQQIVAQLKRGENRLVENKGGVTIMFVDLVGFLSASSFHPPHILVGKYLRDIFSSMDMLTERRQLDKIKTIGNKYMVASGLVSPQGTSMSKKEQAENIVRLACEFMEVVNIVNQKYGINFKCRVGIHSGDVVAGVIGIKKFAYDVWGDAVNTASRMESHGKESKIHISKSTYDVIKDVDGFVFECRGPIIVKGKGEMVTYFVRAIDMEQLQSQSQMANSIRELQKYFLLEGYDLSESSSDDDDDDVIDSKGGETLIECSQRSVF